MSSFISIRIEQGFPFFINGKWWSAGVKITNVSAADIKRLIIEKYKNRNTFFMVNK
ncbi:hypothetical protein BN890_29970 [Bacteroides xylanisolvens SD CC 1b]|uniref:Uncharacterized protein n=1 Tax=Bacteroides xylanisolvens SD CC 1b TaxID=702447 RepID=W6PC57_9BACE|nr:hypothetical protein BN891_20330 [Bacteroides xylanisolvens SD CC 2a]CDM05407.1 hypothetical protein BN890_29970 [Bacteroides xylanisolvens SD CC 1b]